MKIYHFRVLLDSATDVFRDVEISSEDTFLSLHDTIIEAFGFTGNEMASFYMSNDDWDKGDEIALMDMSYGNDPYAVRTMEGTRLDAMILEIGARMLYVYDFFRMWIFYVELVGTKAPAQNADYPRVSLVVGVAPAEYSRESSEHMEFKTDEIDDSFYDEESTPFGESYDDKNDTFESYDDDLDFR